MRGSENNKNSHTQQRTARTHRDAEGSHNRSHHPTNAQPCQAPMVLPHIHTHATHAHPPVGEVGEARVLALPAHLEHLGQLQAVRVVRGPVRVREVLGDPAELGGGGGEGRQVRVQGAVLDVQRVLGLRWGEGQEAHTHAHTQRELLHVLALQFLPATSTMTTIPTQTDRGHSRRRRRRSPG